jgi:hypothetical protein
MGKQTHTSNALSSDTEPLAPSEYDADGRHEQSGGCGEVTSLSLTRNRTTISPDLHFLT